MTRTGYARGIDRLWREVAGGDAILSRGDWSRIDAWFAGGVPLSLIGEVLGDTCRARGGRAPRRLSDVARAVDEAWAVVREGRRSRGTPRAAVGGAAAARWRHRLESEPADSPLRRLIAELLARHDAGESEQAIDETLDRCLGTVLPAALAERVRRDVEDDLALHTSRMSPARLAATARRATIERARRLLDLPRLAGSGDAG